MLLDKFYGNAKLKETAMSMLLRGALPHAILIEGDPGDGRGEFARLLSGSILCPDKGCGRCRNCRKVLSGIHPDLLIIDADSEMKKTDATIGIEKIREIGRKISVYPNDTNKKVYIIKNAQNMTIAAQNSLLKMLEQPPAFVVFILTADKKEKLLDTVLSRCVFLKVARVGHLETARYLRDEKKQSPGEAERISMLGGGSIGNALKLLSKRGQTADMAARKRCVGFMYALCFESRFAFLSFFKVSATEKDKAEFRELLSNLVLLLSDILSIKTSRKALTFSDFEEELLKLAQKLDTDTLFAIFNAISDTRAQLQGNVAFNACINAFQIRLLEEIYG